MRSAERAGGRFLSFSSDRYIIVWKIPGTVIPDTRFLPSLTMFLVPPSACQREPVNQKLLHTPFSTIFNSTWFWRDLFQQILISRKSTSRKERQTFLNASRLILDRSSASFSSIFKNVYKIFLLLPHRPRKKSHAIKETRERSGGKRSKRNAWKFRGDETPSVVKKGRRKGARKSGNVKLVARARREGSKEPRRWIYLPVATSSLYSHYRGGRSSPIRKTVPTFRIYFLSPVHALIIAASRGWYRGRATGNRILVGYPFPRARRGTQLEK